MKNNNGEGSGYYDEKTNRYVFKKSFVDPVTGERKRKSFYSKKSLKEAKQKAAAYIKQRNEEAVANSDFTLSYWMNKWNQDYNSNSVKPKTYERYCMDISKYVEPYDIGNTKLRELTPEILQAHFNMLLESGGAKGVGIAPRSVNSVRRLILAALRMAHSLDLVSLGFDDKTKAVAIARPELRVLTEDEAKALIVTAKNYSIQAGCVITVALGTGMRIGEIFGLKWDSVNVENKTITVQRSVVSTNSGMILQDTVKTARSYRTINIPANVAEALRSYRKYEEALGMIKSGDDLVFTNLKGGIVDTANYTNRTFKRLLAKSNISSDVRFHDLRHTFATLLLVKGVHIKIISEMLGHSSIRITLDTYSHVVPSLQAEAISALDAMFNNDDKANEE